MQCPKCKVKGQTGNFCAECGAKLARAEVEGDAKTPRAASDAKSARAEAARGAKAADSVEASGAKVTHPEVAQTVKTDAESARETSYTNASLVCGIVGLWTCGPKKLKTTVAADEICATSSWNQRCGRENSRYGPDRGVKILATC